MKTQWEISKTESEYLIAECESLNLIIDSDTIEKLMKNIEYGVNELFDELRSTGDLENFLIDRGLKFKPKNSKSILPIDFNGSVLTLPLIAA